MKIWGHIEGDQIIPATSPSVTAQCLCVPVSGWTHCSSVCILRKKISMDEIIAKWESYCGAAQELELPSAPKQFLHYFREDNRPQPKLDRNLENGMAVSVGRLRPVPSMISNLYVCLITLCAVQRVVRY